MLKDAPGYVSVSSSFSLSFVSYAPCLRHAFSASYAFSHHLP